MVEVLQTPALRVAHSTVETIRQILGLMIVCVLVSLKLNLNLALLNFILSFFVFMKDFYKLLFVCIVAYSSFGVVSAYFCTPEQISNNDPSCDGVCGSAHDQPGYDQSNAPGEPLCVL